MAIARVAQVGQAGYEDQEWLFRKYKCEVFVILPITAYIMRCNAVGVELAKVGRAEP